MCRALLGADNAVRASVLSQRRRFDGFLRRHLRATATRAERAYCSRHNHCVNRSICRFLVVDSGRPKEEQVQLYSLGGANMPSWEGTLTQPGEYD